LDASASKSFDVWAFGAARPKSGKLESPRATGALPAPFLTLPFF